MSLGIPGLFPPKGESLINFDFTDYMQNSSYTNFTLGTMHDNSATEVKVLSRQTFESISKSITTATNSSDGLFAMRKVGDEDFDLEIGSTQNIEGEAIVNFLWSFTVNQGNGEVIGGANTTATSYMIVKIRKYDGSTETEIGSGKTATQTSTVSGGDSATDTQLETLKIDCAKTHLTKGDILRVTIETWIELTDYRYANDTLTAVYHIDPLLRNATAINYNKPIAENDLYEYKRPTNFTLKIPFAMNT